MREEEFIFFLNASLTGHLCSKWWAYTHALSRLIELLKTAYNLGEKIGKKLVEEQIGSKYIICMYCCALLSSPKFQAGANSDAISLRYLYYKLEFGLTHCLPTGQFGEAALNSHQDKVL